MSFTISRSLLRFMSTELVMLSNHLILFCPLLLLTLTFPSIRVLSNKLSLHIRWPVPFFFGNTSEICCFIFNFFSKRVLNFLKSYNNNTEISCTSFAQIYSWLVFYHTFVIISLLCIICVYVYTYMHTWENTFFKDNAHLSSFEPIENV